MEFAKESPAKFYASVFRPRSEGYIFQARVLTIHEICRLTLASEEDGQDKDLESSPADKIMARLLDDGTLSQLEKLDRYRALHKLGLMHLQQIIDVDSRTMRLVEGIYNSKIPSVNMAVTKRK